MSIGKSAIKRVENNGYTNVKTSAPDMANSTVVANISTQVEEKILKPIEEKSSKAKKVSKPQQPVKQNSSSKPKSSKNGFSRVAFGEELPYYLL